LKKLPLDPTEEQSSTTREENNGNNLQAVDPESKSAAANNNNAGGGGGGGFTGLKNTVIGTAAAAAGAVGSKIGYYSGSDENAQETKKSSSAASSTAGAGTRPAGKTYTQQATDTVVGMKNSVAASLGLDKPSDPNAPSFLDKTKGYMTTTSDAAKGFTTGATDRAYNSRDRVLTATAPGDEHKALAQQVTESLSKLPATLKESVFGTSSASSTVDSSANDKTPGKDEKPAAHAPQGLVSGITGAVSSLFSKKGDTGSSAAVNDHPPPFPAHLDQWSACWYVTNSSSKNPLRFFLLFCLELQQQQQVTRTNIPPRIKKDKISISSSSSAKFWLPPNANNDKNLRGFFCWIPTFSKCWPNILRSSSFCLNCSFANANNNKILKRLVLFAEFVLSTNANKNVSNCCSSTTHHHIDIWGLMVWFFFILCVCFTGQSLNAKEGSEDLHVTSTSADHQPVNSWVSKFACFPTFDNLKFFIYKLYNTVMLKLRQPSIDQSREFWSSFKCTAFFLSQKKRL
jgi:hypothetical protein